MSIIYLFFYLSQLNVLCNWQHLRC